MTLATSMGHALNGMKTTTDGLSVVARNVANAGTPGYHRQTLNIDKGGNAGFINSSVSRTFNDALQKYYNTQVSDGAYTQTRASFLDTLQTYLGKVGSSNSLDTLYGSLENALQNLSTSPDDYSARAQVVTSAQALAGKLNKLTSQVQAMRADAEAQMATSVKIANDSLAELDEVNDRLASMPNESPSRSALLDQRDRLVSAVGEQLDINASYDSHGVVKISTKTGISLLDGNPAQLTFTPAGPINAATAEMGQLAITTQGGIAFDLISQNGIVSGRLGALIELRDKTLVDAQNQLDQIAAGLAKAFNTNSQAGTAISGGLQVDLGALQKGDDFTFSYSDGGVGKSVRVVRVDDTAKLPMDYVDASGQRVLGLDFSAGIGAVASALGTALGAGSGISASASGSTLSLTGSGTTSVKSLVANSTATANRDGGNGLNLFVDIERGTYTGSLDGISQQLGFAGRITINPDVVADSTLVVQSVTGASMGDATRASYLLDQLNAKTFVSAGTTAKNGSTFHLTGNVGAMIGQTLNYTGNVVSSALSRADESDMAMEALDQKLSADYGVNVDDEMARLMELQNAYAANARVMSVIKELLDTLIRM